jgi:hypothetical protein
MPGDGGRKVRAARASSHRSVALSRADGAIWSPDVAAGVHDDRLGRTGDTAEDVCSAPAGATARLFPEGILTERSSVAASNAEASGS